MKQIGSKILISLIGLTLWQAQAVKMDYETHDDLIQRLESTLSSMSKNAKERHPVIHRLAGLYADRARLKGMKEVEKNCNNCLQSKQDRQKAISHFENSLSHQDQEKQGEILIQLAHLESLNSKDKKALRIFQNVLKKGTRHYSSRVIALAHLNLAEDQFRKGNFKSALKGYKKALKYDLPDRGLAEYRTAWCYLNLGQEKQAIRSLTRILQNPKLMQDSSFHEDVSSDLATLLPRSYLGQKQIQQLLDLSPESKRKENLKTLAEESARVGKNGSALLVWEAYAKEPGFSKVEQVDIQIRIAQLQFDLGHTKQAQQEYRQALKLWETLGCHQDDVCKDIQSRYRKFVTSWNKVRKTRPDNNLLQAYRDYLAVFPDDLDMTQWAALVAQHLQNYKAGTALFRQASNLAQKQNNSKVFEGSLLGEIEMAEKSKDKKLIEESYTHYMSSNPSGKKVWEIRYARASLWSTNNKSQEAFSEFHHIVTTNDKKAHPYQARSADLALEQLAKLKDHEALEKKSQEYAKILPKKKASYLEVARKAVLNQVPILAEGSIDSALKKLEVYPLEGASKEDRVKLYKNKILLSQQLKDVDKAEESALRLYKIKGLSDSDNKYALGILAWAAELKLDFKSAYHYQKKLTPKRTSSRDDLKLAVLAELAGLNAKSHYLSYLKKEKNSRSRSAVQANLVKQSSRPWKELNKYLKDLKRSPEILAEVALHAYASQKSTQQARSILKKTSIQRYPEGQTLARQFQLDDLKSFDRKISRHRLNARNDRLLQKSLKSRLKLLEEADKNVRQALKAKDWSLQVISLAINARENERLQRDLLGLPTPRSLNKQQSSQYKKLLHEQSETYRLKAANISEDIQALFSQDEIIESISKVLKSANRSVRQIIERELKMAESLVRGSAKNRLQALLNLPSQKPSFKEVTVARNAVREDPFNIHKISKLRQLEEQRGGDTMAVYLDSRIEEMKKGARL